MSHLCTRRSVCRLCRIINTPGGEFCAGRMPHRCAQRSMRGVIALQIRMAVDFAHAYDAFLRAEICAGAVSHYKHTWLRPAALHSCRGRAPPPKHTTKRIHTAFKRANGLNSAKAAKAPPVFIFGRYNVERKQIIIMIWRRSTCTGRNAVMNWI